MQKAAIRQYFLTKLMNLTYKNKTTLKKEIINIKANNYISEKIISKHFTTL